MSIQGNDRFQRKLDDRANKKFGFRILVVDDEPSILELVKTALETLESYEVSVASNAVEAVKAVEAAEKPFDCFLLDIQMPDIDGIELLRELRDIPDYGETPILMLTAMSDRKYIDDAFLEGATDYVNKPFDFLELRSRIKLAHSLVDARRKTEKSLQCASDLKEKLDATQKFDFEDPFTIEGMNKALRYVEFDNYILQLARLKLFNSQAVSVKLQDAELFYNLAGCDTFRGAIRDVAWCIERATKEIDGVFSYRGGGVFLAILHGNKVTDSVLGAVSFGELVGAYLKQYIDDDRVEVLVGDQFALRMLSRSSAAGTLQKAVDAVQELEAELRKNDHAQSFDVDDFKPAQATGQKRVYERVLSELFGDESYLNNR